MSLLTLNDRRQRLLLKELVERVDALDEGGSGGGGASGRITALLDANTPLIGLAPFDGMVTGGSWTMPLNESPSDGTYDIVNKGQDGTGTAVVATLTIAGGATELVPIALVVSGTPGVAEGDVLAVQTQPGIGVSLNLLTIDTEPVEGMVAGRARLQAFAVQNNVIIGEVPFDGKVVGAGIVSIDDNTATAGTTSLTNRGQDGSGTTEFAALVDGEGDPIVGGDRIDIPLSSTPADLVVAAGDVLRADLAPTWQAGGGPIMVDIERSQ